MNVLEDLRNDSNIVIMKPDKGNGVVTLNKDDYNQKMENILTDESKFKRLDEDPVKISLQRENQVKSLLYIWKTLNPSTRKRMMNSTQQVLV